MKPYLDALQDILEHGSWQDNRTGVATKMLPGIMLKFDLREGFPAMTTKKLAFGAVKGELLGFLRGANTVKEFNDLGCKVWDANANAPAWLDSEYMKTHNAGDLGRIYGVQWRDWITSDGGKFDQIANLIEQIKTNPTSRRLVVSAWRPDEMKQMALPPCHYSFQVIIEQSTNTMHLLWNQRSCDFFLGIPFNIASYALLLEILARITGYTAGTLTGFLADAHIYENHIDQVMEQLSRTPFSLPKLHISHKIQLGTAIESIEPKDIELVAYECHAAIKAEMAV